jgi:hypothetical protein
MADTKRDIIIDPYFLVPPLLVDARQWEDEDASEFADEDTSTVDPTETDSLVDYGSLPPSISSMRVIEQITKITADGRTVVDVVVEFEESSGSLRDVRVEYAKI